MQQRPISFPAWKKVLANAALVPALTAAYTREILSFLRHGKASHAAATNEVARSYPEWRGKQSAGPAREADPDPDMCNVLYYTFPLPTPDQRVGTVAVLLSRSGNL